MQRLFSTFAHGWPGAGLLVMRVVAGCVLLIEGFLALRSGLSSGQATVQVISMAGGILLLAGLWTPIAGTLVTLLEIWRAISGDGDPSTSILLGTLTGALTVLGPGTWSVDARLFGWKRIDIRKRQGHYDPQ